MEFLTYHLAHLERSYPAPAILYNIGSLNKTSNHFINRRSFPTLNFSFILEGEGSYQIDDRSTIIIKAPFLITQCDKSVYSYGPENNQNWSELYFMYGLESKDHFAELGIYNDVNRYWPIQNRMILHEYIPKLIELLKKRDQPGIIDQIDRLCEIIIVASKQKITEKHNLPYHREVIKIKQMIDQHPELPLDFHDLCSTVGISYSTFRKNWKKYCNSSPQKYLNDRRMREAKRLLIETQLSIGEIAHHLQFEDRLYFSKKFTLNTGMTASQYRKNNEFHTLT